jgi:hypothetical protein
VIEPSSKKPVQGVKARQAVSNRTGIQTKKAVVLESTSKKIKQTISDIPKPTTSRNKKLDTSKTSGNKKVTVSVDNSISQGFVLDSDVSVIESSIIEEKPKRMLATRKTVR